ncbi:uncharacterized protein B0P05DRAFT_463294 [Gilbertella persicaria]|uniref:uncharacterized protein n=1 Tax=Gilbertella persicaria TaxID=101096 RepID=UPI00221FD3F4|nr:uncharacterized protein B0P05DRAFT_463294 [Gilbertella persicaria]KAI8091408.1 hypothetical protein B0P05DRAFT_463294 [Gilbertella persicaria]
MDKNLQCSIPIESDTHWVGGSFVSKDHCIVWTLVSHFKQFNMVFIAIGWSKATFHTITSILRTSNDKVLIVTLSNHPESSGFSIIPLSLDRTLKETTYSIDTTFSNIWPLVDKGDSTFGNITATAPVDSNRLAIGYASGTICIVPLSLALLHLAEISHHLQNRDDVLVFQHAHRDAVTCMIVPEHHGQHYLLSGGQDGAVKIWNLMQVSLMK